MKQRMKPKQNSHLDEECIDEGVGLQDFDAAMHSIRSPFTLPGLNTVHCSWLLMLTSHVRACIYYKSHNSSHVRHFNDNWKGVRGGTGGTPICASCLTRATPCSCPPLHAWLAQRAETAKPKEAGCGGAGSGLRLHGNPAYPNSASVRVRVFVYRKALWATVPGITACMGRKQRLCNIEIYGKDRRYPSIAPIPSCTLSRFYVHVYTEDAVHISHAASNRIN